MIKSFIVFSLLFMAVGGFDIDTAIDSYDYTTTGTTTE